MAPLKTKTAVGVIALFVLVVLVALPLMYLRRDLTPRNDRVAEGRGVTIVAGIGLEEAEALLVDAGAHNFSEQIQTSPSTRLIVTEENAYEVAEELQMPRKPTRSEMVAAIKPLIDPRLPRYATLRYWRFANGTEIELHAKGEVRQELNIERLTIYPDGYPIDKMLRIKNSGTRITKLHVVGRQVKWE